MPEKFKKTPIPHQKIISRGIGVPGRGEGRDGDMQVRWLKGQGLFIFYKWNTRWYTSRLSTYQPKSSERKDPVYLPIGKEPSFPGEITYKSGKVKLKKGNAKSSQIISVDKDGIADAPKVELTRTTELDGDTNSAMQIVNSNPSASSTSHLTIKTAHESADSYIFFINRSAETGNTGGWCIGNDASDSDTFNFIDMPAAGGAVSPSYSASDRTRMSLSGGGNLTIEGEFECTILNASNTIAATTDTDKFLVIGESGDTSEVRYRTGAEVRSDIGAGTSSFGGALNDLSDVTYSSGDLTITSLDKIVSGALEFDSSGDITLDADGGDIYFNDDSLSSLDDSGSSHNFVKFTSPANLQARNHIITIVDMKQTFGVDGTGSGPSISFKKWQSKAGLFSGASAEEDTGDIAFLCENNWKEVAADRDSEFVVRNSLNGDLQTCFTVKSDNSVITYGDVKVPATKKIYLDAGTDTYIYESGADIMKLVVGDVDLLVLTEAGGGASDSVIIPTLTPLGFGAVGTSIYHSSDDIMNFKVGGDLVFSLWESGIAGNQVNLLSNPLYFDDGSHTKIHESSDDVLDITVGNLNIMKLDEANDKVEVLGAHLEIDAGKAFYLDGGANSYIYEHSDDYVRYVVGGDVLLTMGENGNDGNQIIFNDASVGFLRDEATFSVTGIIGSGGTDDTDIDFRFTNKFRLEMTGDITTINLIFPSMSGNFLLVCTTNGDHDVSNWKVFESDESAATTTDVMWAGGSIPAFTSSGVDIVSFYWDSIEQQAYGTASLAFAAP